MKGLEEQTFVPSAVSKVERMLNKCRGIKQQIVDLAACAEAEELTWLVAAELTSNAKSMGRPEADLMLLKRQEELEAAKPQPPEEEEPDE